MQKITGFGQISAVYHDLYVVSVVRKVLSKGDHKNIESMRLVDAIIGF